MENTQSDSAMRKELADRLAELSLVELFEMTDIDGSVVIEIRGLLHTSGFVRERRGWLCAEKPSDHSTGDQSPI